MLRKVGQPFVQSFSGKSFAARRDVHIHHRYQRLILRPGQTCISVVGGEKIYQSAVSAISDQELEISMPTSGGRMVLFQLERECSIVFYTKGGMYNCTAVVKKRYRKENLYLLRIVITSGLQKFQRREFFRIPYTTPLKYYEISEQTAQMQTTEELFAEIQKPEYIDQVREGTIQNLHPSQTTAPGTVIAQRIPYFTKAGITAFS